MNENSLDKLKEFRQLSPSTPSNNNYKFKPI